MRKVKEGKWIKINKDYKDALEEIKKITNDSSRNREKNKST